MTSEQEWEWWGQTSLRSKYLLEPIGLLCQAAVVRRSSLPWREKLACWRQVGACAARFATKVARRNNAKVLNKVRGMFGVTAKTACGSE
jgi:hypothetical protein